MKNESDEFRVLLLVCLNHTLHEPSEPGFFEFLGGVLNAVRHLIDAAAAAAIQVNRAEDFRRRELDTLLAVMLVIRFIVRKEARMSVQQAWVWSATLRGVTFN